MAVGRASGVAESYVGTATGEVVLVRVAFASSAPPITSSTNTTAIAPSTPPITAPALDRRRGGGRHPGAPQPSCGP
ncbi:hypothetical protein Skr01_39890 [Sphaerisporangium krabiense]|nr:hypothetical protein Skr01_39890 [Sphaerisporangium krabiense]